MNEIRHLKNTEPRVIETVTERTEIDDPTAFTAREVDPFARGMEGASFLPGEDRRVAQRYRAKDGRCWLGWQEAGGFRQSAGWIIDISVSGGLIATDAAPPTDRSIWLRLDNPIVPDWAETRLVAVQSSQGGIFAARVVFRGTCPYAFIKEVAFSTRSGAARPEPSSSWNLNAW